MRTVTRIVGLMVAMFWGTNAANADQIFVATLSGDQEVPPIDTQMSGRVKIHISDDLSSGEFSLTVNNGVRVQQAHIHCAEAGVNGPVVVWLGGLHMQGWDIDGEWVSNATFTDGNVVDQTCGATVADLTQAMLDGRAYANVHTQAHPGGEIRGQISVASEKSPQVKSEKSRRAKSK